MKKILIIASYAPSLINFRGPLLKALINSGHEVTAVAPLEDLDDREQHDIKAGLSAIDVHLLVAPLSRTGFNPLHDLSYLLSLRRIINDVRPNRIMAYTIKPVIYGGLAARSLKHEHFYPMFTGLGYAFSKGVGIKRKIIQSITKLLLKAAVKKARTVIFQNPDDQALIKEAGITGPHQSTAVVNGSGVDLSYYRAHMLEKPPQHPLFLMIARLLVEKGVREYAAAAKRLKEKYPESRFVLVGPIDKDNPASPDKREIAEWTAIDYIGPVAEVRPYLRECDVYILPSYYREGTPRSILEAMATGRAVVTCDTPGCRETIIDGKSGFFAPARNTKGLADVMERFITQPELCVDMGERAQKRAMEKYDVHLVNEQLFKILDILYTNLKQ